MVEGLRAKWRSGVLPWLLVALAILVALRAPGYADFGIWRAIAEFVLIIAGVLVGLLLLPDEDERLARALERAQMDFVRNPLLVQGLTEDDFYKLVTDVISARVGSEIGVLAGRHGWQPILEAMQREPSAIWRDFDYSAELTPLERKIDGRDLYGVRAELSGQRALPHDEAWISFARTPGALRGEFAEGQCLTRELVDVSRDLWETILAQGLLEARLTVRNIDCPDPVVERVGEDLIRFKFTIQRTSSQDMVAFTERLRFVMAREVTHYPVRMASYFCLGRSKIELRLNDSDVQELDAFPSLAGDMELNALHEGIHVDRSLTGRVDRVTVTTSDAVVLWPGSGVIFVWRK